MNCPICLESYESDREHLVLYKTNHPVFASCSIQICLACKSGWVPNPPTSEQLQAYYSGGAYGGRTFLRSLFTPDLILERNQALARWRFVRKYFKRDSVFSVCDIGAGYGCTYEVAKKEGLDVDFFAFENSPPLCRRIQKMGGSVLGDFFNYRGKGQFDLLWVSHILEHYVAPDDFLGKLKLLLKPGGACFVEIPCLDFEFKDDVTSHLLFFSRDGLRRLLEHNNFKILGIDTVGPFRQSMAVSDINERPSAGRWSKILRRPKSLVEDLENCSFLGKWNLEKYGGERIWLRAIFQSL